MVKRYRRTLLEEFETFCGLAPAPNAEEFRVEVGSFVIEFVKANGKAPSNKEIIEELISQDEINILNDLYAVYLKVAEVGYDAHKEYAELAQKTGYLGVS